jgi:hypothetical protein
MKIAQFMKTYTAARTIVYISLKICFIQIINYIWKWYPAW